MGTRVVITFEGSIVVDELTKYKQFFQEEYMDLLQVAMTITGQDTPVDFDIDVFDE